MQNAKCRIKSRLPKVSGEGKSLAVIFLFLYFGQRFTVSGLQFLFKGLEIAMSFGPWPCKTHQPES